MVPPATSILILDCTFSNRQDYCIFTPPLTHRYGRYTRQALFKHERIRHAYEFQKKKLPTGSGLVRPASSPELMRIALEKIERLESENRRLESENQRLLEQFAKWAYNAHARGLGYEFLSNPLPGVNRGQTIYPKKV